MNWAEMTPAEIREFYDRNMYMSLLDLSCETGLTVPELRKILLTDEEDMLFRELSDDEELEFRQAARDQYKPGEPIESSWHPIYRDECRLIDTKHRIIVAKEFVEMHRIGVEAWTTRLQNPTMDLDEVYLKIYAEMMSGSFGEVRENDVPGGVEYEIEISKHDSVNGLPFLYTW